MTATRYYVLHASRVNKMKEFLIYQKSNVKKQRKRINNGKDHTGFEIEKNNNDINHEKQHSVNEHSKSFEFEIVNSNMFDSLQLKKRESIEISMHDFSDESMSVLKPIVSKPATSYKQEKYAQNRQKIIESEVILKKDDLDTHQISKKNSSSNNIELSVEPKSSANKLNELIFTEDSPKYYFWDKEELKKTLPKIILTKCESMKESLGRLLLEWEDNCEDPSKIEKLTIFKNGFSVLEEYEIERECDYLKNIKQISDITKSSVISFRTYFLIVFHWCIFREEAKRPLTIEELELIRKIDFNGILEKVLIE